MTLCNRCLLKPAYCECASGPRVAPRHPASCECSACDLGRNLMDEAYSTNDGSES